MNTIEQAQRDAAELAVMHDLAEKGLIDAPMTAKIKPAQPMIMDTDLKSLAKHFQLSALTGDPITLSHISAGTLLHAMTTGPSDPSHEIATDHPYKRLTDMKTNAIMTHGYQITGYVLRRAVDEVCISECGAVRWLSGHDHYSIMHPNGSAPSTSDWRPASMLPDSDISVLMFSPSMDEPVWPGYHKDLGGWTCSDGFAATPTHWMPMPAGPVVQLADHAQPTPLEVLADVAGDKPATDESGKCWSVDNEDFNNLTLGDLLDDHEDLKVGDTVYVGDATIPRASQLCDSSDVIEMMGDRASDIGGEYADDYPDVSSEAKAELDEFLAKWIGKHARPTFYTASNFRPYVLSADDFETVSEEGRAA